MPDYSAGRVCNSCDELKPIEAYYLTFQKYIQQPCKDCITRRREDPEYREHALQRTRLWRQALRAEVIAALGGCCACCGEIEDAFLAIDHINGGGTAERKTASGTFYTRVKRAGFPRDVYRVLCHNCNFAIHLLGVCPHQSSR